MEKRNLVVSLVIFPSRQLCLLCYFVIGYYLEIKILSHRNKDFNLVPLTIASPLFHATVKQENLRVS
jgi:hypothetical protein